MICKKHKGYLILGILAIVFYFAYIASKFISPGPYSFPGVYEFIFVLFVTPCFSVIYGTVSYILTKQAVIPNLLFAISFNMFLALTIFISAFFEETIGELTIGIGIGIGIGIIIFIISTASSFVTKFIVFCFANHKEKKRIPQ